MNIIAIVIALVIVSVGIYFSQKNRAEVVEQTPIPSEVLSEVDKEEEKIEDQEEAKEADKPGTPTPSNTRAPVSLNLSEYRYPNSQIISAQDASLLLSSTDDSDEITDWYKEKIRSEGMTTKTFVKTKTNDNVLNKLVGADAKREIRVEISKQSNETTVKISVTIITSN